MKFQTSNQQMFADSTKKYWLPKINKQFQETNY